MPKVSEQHRERRREEIVAAAVRSFARNGFHATSMSDIIAESGLSAGAIYGYFDSKKDLVQAVAAEIYDPARPELAERTDADGDPLHPVDFVGRFLRATIGRIGEPAIVVQVWGQSATDDDMRELFSGVYSRLLAAFEAQLALWLTHTSEASAADVAARAHALAPVLIGIVQGGIFQSALVDGFDLSGYVAAARPLFDGLS